MANPEQIARLRDGASAWNAWRNRHLDYGVDLTGADLREADLTGVNLYKANLSRADLTGALLHEAYMNSAAMSDANLSGAKLIRASLGFADLTRAILIGADFQGAILNGTNLCSANIDFANLRDINLRDTILVEATLRNTNLAGANLDLLRLGEIRFDGANLENASLEQAYMLGANLNGANLRNIKLYRANLTAAELRGADLRNANLRMAELIDADLTKADLAEANLDGANLMRADLRKSTLCGVDLGSATLQYARLDGAKATGIKLWETQRAGWSIKGIICERAYWDKEAKEPTEYAPGEFERLYSDQTCIELFYQGGVSTFELNTLPALLHHLASLHPGSNIRLKSIEEAGGGAKISISVGDADPETTERIRADAEKVHQAQLALRDNETRRLQIEKEYLEKLLIGKLIPAMLTAGAPQNVFNAPVTGVVISSGESKVDFHQTINDNSAILALLKEIKDHRADLKLSTAKETKLETELQSATTELQKPNPDKSVIAKSIKFLQKIATDAASKVAGKLVDDAVSTDWPRLAHELSQHLLNWK